MIELHEAVTIAEQINRTLKGKRIRSGIRGNSPHKFAFYSGPPEHYATNLAGKTVGRASANGALIVVAIEPGWAMVLGGGGERILHHTSAQTLPKKHQLLLEFDDATYLTVSVQGWGSVHLIKPADVDRCCGADKGLTPIDRGFTFDYLTARIAAIAPDDPRSVKFFVISQPGVKGVANGYLQDVLFRAKLHPRTPVVRLSSAQRRSLHKSLVSTMKQAVKQHGRDDEHDLFDQPGGYHRILSAEAAGKPCPNCKTRIVKESFLGGAIYFCPKCQPAPPQAARKSIAGA